MRLKAWVNYSASNTTIQSSHNIAAIVTIGGDVARPQIHFDKPFKDNTYIVNGNIRNLKVRQKYGGT